MARGRHAQRKGAEAEHELAELFRAHGFNARRGDAQRWYGGRLVSDVEVPALPWLHVEGKRTERVRLHQALDQARRDAGHRAPVVFTRRNRGEWVAVLPAAVLLELLRAAGDAIAWPPRGTALHLELRAPHDEEAAG